MKKFLTFLVLVGILLSLQVSLVSAQDSNPTDTPEVTTYVVEEGDTAESIADVFKVSVEDLLAVNELDDADEIAQMVGEDLIIPPPAQPTEEVTEKPTEEVTEEPTPEATEEPTEPAEEVNPPSEVPTEEATEEPAPVPTEELTEEPTPVPTEEVNEEPTAEPTEEVTEEPTAEPTEEVTNEQPVQEVEEPPTSREGVTAEGPTSDSEEVVSAGQQPGSFTTQIIAIANLNTSGGPEAPALTLYDIDSANEIFVSGMPSVYPGGVGFVTSDQFSTGRYAGVIESTFPAAAVALTQNNSAKTADAYPGFNTPAPVLYGTLIFNKHANFESILYCQNAGNSPATVEAALYKTGEGAPKVTLSASVPANETVVWDIADNATVQASWPGGNGQYGYAVFSSANDIACVVDNERMVAPYVLSQFNAVPAAYAGTDLRVPLIFNGHGTSSTNNKSYKWNTGVSLVNINPSPANVTVTYTSGSYVHSCTNVIPANGSIVWYAPEVGYWGCGPLAWSYPGGPTFGSLQVTSNVDILAIGNSNRYDTKAGLGAGYSSLGATPGSVSDKLVCALAFNKNPGTDWITGIQVANVGPVATDIVFRMVRANADPAGGGNSAAITKTNVSSGNSATAYFPEEGTALANFEGAVFVQAANPSALIVGSSSNTNYNSLGAAALYDCVNY